MKRKKSNKKMKKVLTDDDRDMLRENKSNSWKFNKDQDEVDYDNDLKYFNPKKMH